MMTRSLKETIFMITTWKFSRFIFYYQSKPKGKPSHISHDKHKHIGECNHMFMFKMAWCSILEYSKLNANKSALGISLSPDQASPPSPCLYLHNFIRLKLWVFDDVWIPMTPNANCLWERLWLDCVSQITVVVRDWRAWDKFNGCDNLDMR